MSPFDGLRVIGAKLRVIGDRFRVSCKLQMIASRFQPAPVRAMGKGKGRQ